MMIDDVFQNYSPKAWLAKAAQIFSEPSEPAKPKQRQSRTRAAAAAIAVTLSLTAIGPAWSSAGLRSPVHAESPVIGYSRVDSHIGIHFVPDRGVSISDSSVGSMLISRFQSAPIGTDLRQFFAADSPFSVGMDARVPAPPQLMPRSELSANEIIALSKEARTAIGPSGVTRLHQFAVLKPGWDSGDGERLNPESVRSFSKFMAMTKICPAGTCIFMSHAGSVIINWHQPQGKLVELEFGPNELQYFFEQVGTEGTVDYSPRAIYALISSLPATATSQ